MEDKSNNFSLINLSNSKIPEKAYDDVLSNPSKKLGEALGTIINVGNTLLWPIKWANERTRIFFENNLKKYEKSISDIPLENIVEVPTEISMPILERFTYVSNEELSNAFVKLLTSATNSTSINIAHPGFIQIIDRLSPDEATILKYFADKECIPKLSIQHKHKFNDEDVTIRNQYYEILNNQTTINENVSLKFPNNHNLYFDNLISLGLIKEQDSYFTKMEDEFIKIEEIHKEILDLTFDQYSEEYNLKKAKTTIKGMYEKTEYGKMFIIACIK